jgi:iron only hydrogenase large subunit-like protein
VKYVEQSQQDFIPNLSTCKSPQQMLGALVKSWWAEREGVDPADVYSVSIMPCTAKKYEAARPEMMREGLPDVDLVLTTRELARLLRMRGIDLASLEPQPPDDPMGERSGAGKIFGTTGGVMEAAIRTAHHLLTGRDLENPVVEAVRGAEGLRTATVDADGLKLEVGVVSGLGNAARVLEEVRQGRRKLHVLEVMTCAGGCVNGGGQPLGTNVAAVRQRAQALYRIDGAERLRCSHHNPSVQKLYAEYLGAPLGEKSHELLHAHWSKQDVVR